MYHFINGDFVPQTEAKIFIHDLALLRGYGIFDFFRTYHRKPVLIDSYLNRFVNSASIAGLKIPLKNTEIKSIIEKLISQSSYQECAFRMMLTGGYSLDAFTSTKPNFLILTENFNKPSEKEYLDGVNIITHEYQRDFPEAKTLNYSTAIIFNSRNPDKKASEILYYNQDKISEASRSNFFVIQGERLITAGENILKGITRQTVLSIAKNDFKIEQVNFPIGQLSNVDEAFITSTIKGILPVVKIDDLIIGDGKPGKKTVFLTQLLKDFIDRSELLQ